MELQKILDTIRTLPGCYITPPKSHKPKIEEGLIFPDDLKLFYSLCDGITLFENSDYPIHIVSSQNFILANPLIVGERCEDDISATWYIVAQEGSSEYITIDLHPKRLGRCYDSFYDRHGVVGECAIVALSFSELLSRLVYNKGERWYWLQKDFVSLGDAYDDL